MKFNDDVPLGAKVLLEVVFPWVITNLYACDDSYFTSISTAKLLHGSRLKCIHIVKIVTKKYLITYLGTIELEI